MTVNWISWLKTLQAGMLSVPAPGGRLALLVLPKPTDIATG